MGTKIEIETIEGMRKVVHDTVDRTFNAMKTIEGKPLDEVNFQQEMHTRRTEGDGFLVEGKTITLHVKYQHPILRLAPNTEMLVRASDGLFRLVDPSEPRINHLVQVLIGLHTVDHEAAALDMLVERREFETGLHISALAQISALMFERVGENLKQPSIEPSDEGIEKVRDGEPKTTEPALVGSVSTDVTDAENTKIVEELAEAEAKQRYEEALARGLSDAEAREEGWPSKTEE